jgi:hypothetical protein
LKGNAVRLHIDKRGGYGQGDAGPPASLGESFENVDFEQFSDFEWITTVEIYFLTIERSKQLQAMEAGLLQDSVIFTT